MAGLKSFTQVDMRVAPTEQNHLARLKDVLEYVAGKTAIPVRAVLTTNFAGTYASGVLTQTTAAEVVIDGVTLVLNDRVLLTGQTDQTQNGVYTITTLGVTAGAQAVLTRADDFNQSAEFVNGMRIPVTQGTANAGTVWKLTTADPITLDSSNLIFVIDIAKFTEIAEAKFTVVGDASTTVYPPFTHNFDTKNVSVDLFDELTGETVYVAVQRSSVNDIIITVGEPLGVGNNLTAIVRAVVTPV
jgi:hypothetical protein